MSEPVGRRQRDGEVLDLDLYVDGRFVPGSTGERYEIVSPVTGSVVATVPVPGRDDVLAATTAARAAQREWAHVGAFERAAVCHRIGDAIAARTDELARLQTLEQGKPLAESVADITEAAELFHLHAEDMVRLNGETLPVRDPSKRMITFRRPVGVWAIVTPWNFPVLMAAEFVAPGLVTGNAHVLKPPSHTSAAVLRTVEVLEGAGLPRGLVNVLPGDGGVGEMLVSDDRVDAIGFIGSSATGARIQEVAGLKRKVMECSGNGPLVVCADADVRRAARAAVYGAYFCAGQVCCATERVIVDASRHDEFVEACLAEAASVRLGDPFEPSTNLGPLNNEGVAAKMDRHVEDAVAHGAEVLLGGRRRIGMATPLYYELTIVDRVRPEMAVAREESFGPIVPVLTADGDDALLELANADALGLQAAVFTKDLARAFRFMENLEVGQVIVNDTTDYWDINMPFGGAGGRGTGWGRIGGKWTLMDMSDVRTGILDLS
ncbi:MAG: aldehyde dehydrogenase family protein [Actinomycetota bacterium]|nr:aldehyde dehydrogenase family protein [Actinomycetota bacterium]